MSAAKGLSQRRPLLTTRTEKPSSYAVKPGRPSISGNDGPSATALQAPTASAGRPLEPGNLVKREFVPALRRAGLRRITFHSLRHSFTALLIAQGESIKYIQSQLGHASVQTTLDRYGHLLPATHKGAAKRLDVTLFGNSVSKQRGSWRDS